ncbi:MAG: SDR family NAD(P)-dependent oxidoreductase [FCB group bacterium]|nr:SDR family NAD(P)-dependent oxidoreductase [FCB group bacterium]
MFLREKTIVVTGAGSGIGRELVFALLEKDARIAALDINASTLKEMQERAGDKGHRISLHVLNIADQVAVEALPAQVIEQHGMIDGVINNAGIIQPFVKINSLDYKTIRRVMDINFYGTLYMCKAFLPHLLQRPEALLVNISSMGGFLPVPGQSIYGASKAAVKLITEALHAELTGTNVYVSIVFPGAIATNIMENSGIKRSNTPDEAAQEVKIKPLPADVAARMIVKGIEKKKVRMFIGKDARMMDVLYRISPGFAGGLITKNLGSLLSD